MNVINMKQHDDDDYDVIGPALLSMYIRSEYMCLEKKHACGTYDGCGEKNGCQGCPLAASHFGLMGVNRHQQLYIKQKALEMFQSAHSKRTKAIKWATSVRHTFDDVVMVVETLIAIIGSGVIIGLALLPIIFCIWIVRLLLT